MKLLGSMITILLAITLFGARLPVVYPDDGSTGAEAQPLHDVLITLGELATDPFQMGRFGFGRMGAAVDDPWSATGPGEMSLSMESRQMYCDRTLANDCFGTHSTFFPQAPRGYRWMRLDGRYTFSAYSHAEEANYMGELVDIPGIFGLQAKEDFLYSVSGLGMQGSGTIWRLDNRRHLRPINIRYISGHWELHGEDVIIEDHWYYAETRRPVEVEQIDRIRLVDARFAIAAELPLTPYYSVAAPPSFESGTQLFVPSLSDFGGVYEVQDRGGAFSLSSRRFDLYVGKDMDNALKWLRLDNARTNLVVYALFPNDWK